MKPIIRHRQFEKSYRSRITLHRKLVDPFTVRLGMFMQGMREHSIDDHALVGAMKGLRAFSVGGDTGVVYRDAGSSCEFLDTGAHNWVY